MKIATIVGTRPEIIRLACILPKLNECCKHTLIHTGQNWDTKLSDIFFDEMGLKRPDIFLGNRSSNFGEQIGLMFQRLEEEFANNRPDKVLILGDTSSGLCSIVCRRLGIPVYHMEAGNRCHDDRVPEEINRRIIDHTANINLPYSRLSKEYLVGEGLPLKSIYVTGNPIGEVLATYDKQITSSSVLTQMGLEPGQYFVSTFHRSENVDDETTLNDIVCGLELVIERSHIPVVCSVHPRTRSKIEKFFVTNSSKLLFHEPMGFFDFVKLESNARALISDSGTCPEEACLYGVPSVIIRKTTERPELIQCGSALICGTEVEDIANAVDLMTRNGNDWLVPEEYTYSNVSERVLRILMGNIC